VVCAPLEHAFCSAVKRSEARVSSCCKCLRISSRADGKELYYTDADNKIMAVDIIEHGASLQVGTPHTLWQPRLQPVVNPPYAATGDGKRFLANELPLQSPSHLTVILNWDAKLKKIGVSHQPSGNSLSLHQPVSFRSGAAAEEPVFLPAAASLPATGSSPAREGSE